MAKNDIDKLTTAAFLDEIHHLLWIEPGENGGKWDEGWNCRDHALLSSIVCQLLKMTATVIYGEAMFIQGLSGDAPPVGLRQETHAWLGLDGLGFMDLSPRLMKCREPAWRPWPLQCIAMNRCIPDGVFAIATSPEDFERRVNSATHMPSRHAIYFGHEHNGVDVTLVEKAFDVVNSPLSVKLEKRFDVGVYPKAAIHLFKLLKGESRSLRQQSQDDAWETISRQPGNPLGWLKMKGAIR